MSVSSHHQDFDQWSQIWKKCRDVIGGQEKVHEAGALYLQMFKDESVDDYNARRQRAVFYEATARTIDALKGMLFRKAPKVIVSDEDILKNVNLEGFSFTELMMDGAEEALSLNRFGVLVDYPVVDKSLTQADVNKLNLMPSMNIYKAESIINWGTTVINGRLVLSLVVLAEDKETAIDEFSSETAAQYRVFDLQDGTLRVRIFDSEDNQVGGDLFPRMGINKLDHIPFYFYPSIDIQKPPLLGMVNMNLSHYTTNADYEHGCHLSGLPTLFISGYIPKEGEKIYIGGPTAQVLPESDATAFYVEVSGEFGALVKNLESKEQKLAILGSRMLEAQKKQVETVEVATIHRGGEASTLATIGLMLSKVFTRSLQTYVEYMGESGEDVSVELNKDFTPFGISPQLITALLQAVQAGKMSHEAFFDTLKKQGELYGDSVEFEDEQMKIDNQAPPMP